MLSMSRYQESTNFKPLGGFPLRPPILSLSRRVQMASQEHLSFVGDTRTFQFDFPLQNEALVLKPPSRDESFRSDLSAFPKHTSGQPSSRLPSQHPYEPPSLQNSSGSITQNPSHPPSNYIHSTVSEHSYPPFPSSTSSRSLSPGDNPGWTDDSSSSIPPDHSPFESFAISTNLDQSHLSSASIISSSPPAQESNARGSNEKSDFRVKSKKSDSEAPLVKLGPNGLAEDQPPTAQGKMRTRVYVACLQCRSRKIRCDGGKPKCQKCARRASECDYDPAPKRRGPDKKPGARQRTSKRAKMTQEAINEENPSSKNASTLSRLGEPLTNVPPSNKRRKSNPSAEPIVLSPEPASSTSLQSLTSSEILTSIPSEGRSDISLGLTSVPLLSELQEQSEKLQSHIVEQTHTFPHLSSYNKPFSFDYGSETVKQTPYIDPVAPHHNDGYGGTYAFSDFPSAYITPIDEQEDDQCQHGQKRKWCQYEIGSEPSLDFTRKTWWDNLLSCYVPGSDRTTVARVIHTDLQYLFKISNYFLSFINVPLFFSIFCNPVERERMQPSLVLAGLALSTFMKSSEINRGSTGRFRALWLRDAAQASLEASFNGRWIDPSLAQAAWLLALFETCAHPYHSSERSNSSMLMLDSIIRSLSLTAIDADHPYVSVFQPRSVPTISIDSDAKVSRQIGCSCRSLTLGQVSRSSHEHTPMWTATAAWNPDWTIAEIRKEECRRLCWSTLQLAAGHTAHAAAFSVSPVDYFCIQPANYALLFPGESLLDSPCFTTSHSPKESIWALYSRAMLLWNSCLRMRSDNVSDAEKASFAVNAWIESQAIEEALEAHTCGCDQAFLFQGKDYLFITRMCISYEFRRFIPHPESGVNNLFNRKKAEAWLFNQANIAQRIMQGLHTVTGHRNNILAQRPFFIWWFMGQVARALSLWHCDNSLIVALEVCQAYFPAMDYLACLWPCPTQRTRYLALHARLVEACQTAGISVPPHPKFDLLAPGSPPINVV